MEKGLILGGGRGREGMHTQVLHTHTYTKELYLQSNMKGTPNYRPEGHNTDHFQ